jgi:hypothetical protein
MKWCLFSPLTERERFGVSIYIHANINTINRSSVLSAPPSSVVTQTHAKRHHIKFLKIDGEEDDDEEKVR